jgi:hypothetical protein
MKNSVKYRTESWSMPTEENADNNIEVNFFITEEGFFYVSTELFGDVLGENGELFKTQDEAENALDLKIQHYNDDSLKEWQKLADEIQHNLVKQGVWFDVDINPISLKQIVSNFINKNGIKILNR